MWVVVMFDLPVIEKTERKAATAFRIALLDMGFSMSQFSVYMRFCTSQTATGEYIRASLLQCFHVVEQAGKRLLVVEFGAKRAPAIAVQQQVHLVDHDNRDGWQLQ